MGWIGSACNSGVPEPASMNIPSAHLTLTIVRIATDPFLPRHNLTLSIQSADGCSATAELFPDTGHAGRRNVYLAGSGLIYVVGQFDARVIDPGGCRITLSEFRHLARDVVFLGGFDEDHEHHWVYLPASERPEQPLGAR
jgi:hypothetical protein